MRSEERSASEAKDLRVSRLGERVQIPVKLAPYSPICVARCLVVVPRQIIYADDPGVIGAALCGIPHTDFREFIY